MTAIILRNCSLTVARSSKSNTEEQAHLHYLQHMCDMTVTCMLPHEGGDVVNATPFDGIETARLKGISQFQYRKHDERVFPQLIKPLANFDTIASEKRFINISERQQKL